jgi:hypothetical protein
MKLIGFTVVDDASGLIVGFRRTAGKAFDLRDKYVGREMAVLVAKLTLEEILVLERAEAGRSPVAFSLSQAC